MSPFILVDSLSILLDYSKLIQVHSDLSQKLEIDWIKYRQTLPEKKTKTSEDEVLREEVISLIENRVLIQAINCETLKPDIKLSIDRTTLRLHSMRTTEEIIGFFNNAILSERGVIVQDALHKEKLLAFEDIKDEVNKIYEEKIQVNMH
jgi:hypothetical protein